MRWNYMAIEHLSLCLFSLPSCLNIQGIFWTMDENNLKASHFEESWETLSVGHKMVISLMTHRPCDFHKRLIHNLCSPISSTGEEGAQKALPPLAKELLVGDSCWPGVIIVLSGVGPLADCPWSSRWPYTHVHVSISNWAQWVINFF